MPAHSVLLATEKPFAAGAVKEIEGVLDGAGYSLTKLEDYKATSDLTDALAKAEAVIVRSDKMTGEIMDACKDSLKLIVRAGAGVDTIDLNAASERGIKVLCLLQKDEDRGFAFWSEKFTQFLILHRHGGDEHAGSELERSGGACFRHDDYPRQKPLRRHLGLGAEGRWCGLYLIIHVF